MARTELKPNSKSTKGVPESSEPVLIQGNTEKGDVRNLNFRVPAEFHKEFKMTASMHEISMVDLLQDAFTLYKQNKLGL